MARVRAPIEPIYHLRIAICPRCGVGAVRRRVGEGRKRFFRIADAVSGLILSLFVTTSLLVWSAGMVVGLAGELQQRGEGPRGLLRLHDPMDPAHFSRERLVFLGAYLGLALGSGAWIASSLSHWRVRMILPLWTAILLAGVSIGPIRWLMMQPIGAALGHTVPYSGPAALEWWLRAQLLGVFTLLMFAGIPIGKLIQMAERMSRSAIIRWRLRQLRAERRQS